MSRREFKTADGTVTVRTQRTDLTLRAEFEDGEVLEGALTPTGPGEGVWTLGGDRHRVAAAEQGDEVWVAVDGRVWRFTKMDPDADTSGAGGATENMVAAPMPGKVTKLMVAEGDEVEEGKPLLIVEAMKMEHTLRAPVTGKVVEVRCAEGEQVQGNVPLIEIEPAEG